MELKELQRNWNAFGHTDPLGAILTEPSKMRGGWDEREFFGRGVEEIAAVMEYVESLRPGLPRGEALDFGCGVGRLTQALARYFDRCSGVDIAPSMIDLANGYNQHGRRCQYFLNDVNDLKLFRDNRFDFVYSNIVLQHMKPEYATHYIQEFIRVMAPGGLIVFQLPSGPADREKSTSKPLPDSGFRALIEPIDPPAAISPGSRATFRVRVTNVGDATWPARWNHEGLYQVMLGNHWSDESGAVVAFEDGRTEMARDLAPGEEVELALAVKAPLPLGVYTLELDMVQEHVSWFQWRGSEPARVPVQVKYPRYSRLSRIFQKVTSPADPVEGPSAEGESVAIPIMEMYSIEQPEVEALIAASGGTVVDIQSNSCPAWVHARYCVTKS